MTSPNDPMSKLALEGLGASIFEAADLANIGLAVTVIEATGPRNLFLSDAAVRLLGFSREELLSRPALSNVAPEERARLAGLARDRLEGTRIATNRLETVVVHKDGKRVPIAMASSRLLQAGAQTTVSFFWDISEQRAAEEARRGEADRLRRLVASAPDGILLVRGPIMLSANPAAARLLGVADPRSLVGRSLEEFVVPEELALMRRRMMQAMTDGPLVPQEYRVRRADGTFAVAEVTSLPFDHDGQPP